jgi:RNA polymerase sigma-70 factor (ECF subfamily)
MHFRKRLPCRISLDDSNDHYEDGRPVAREYEVRDHRLEGSVNRVALARAISELSEGYRTVFLLHDVEGYEHHEIAELLGCSAGTSKSQLHKARMRIRDFLGGSRETQTETGQEERPSTMRGRFQSAYSSSR